MFINWRGHSNRTIVYVKRVKTPKILYIILWFVLTGFCNEMEFSPHPSSSKTQPRGPVFSLLLPPSFSHASLALTSYCSCEWHSMAPGILVHLSFATTTSGKREPRQQAGSVVELVLVCNLLYLLTIRRMQQRSAWEACERFLFERLTFELKQRTFSLCSDFFSLLLVFYFPSRSLFSAPSTVPGAPPLPWLLPLCPYVVDVGCASLDLQTHHLSLCASPPCPFPISVC